MMILIPGIVLTAVSWTVAWARIDVLSEFSFFPLWIGYILVLNGLGEVLFRSSLIGRMGRSFLLLFVLSVPLWWFFELLNSIVRNWHYVFPHPVSDLQYVVQASIDFATVIPAVLSTGHFFHRLLLRRRLFPSCKPLRVRRSHLVLSVLTGLAAFALLPLFPRQTFPLVWIAPILLLEPAAYLLGAPSILRLLERGRCLLPVSIMCGALFNGFWWELWNYHSLPKWVYTVPYVGFLKIFEMPALGYLGYPFFGLIVFTCSAIACHVVFRTDLACLFADEDRPSPASPAAQ